MFLRNFLVLSALLFASSSYGADINCSVRQEGKILFSGSANFEFSIDTSFNDPENMYKLKVSADNKRVSLIMIKNMASEATAYVFDKYSKQKSLSVGLLIKDIPVEATCELKE